MNCVWSVSMAKTGAAAYGTGNFPCVETARLLYRKNKTTKIASKSQKKEREKGKKHYMKYNAQEAKKGN